MTDGLSHQICTVIFFLLFCVGTVSPAHGPCPSCLALRCPVDLTPSSVCSCQMDKREHMYLLGLWFRLACSLCYPPLTFWTPSACLSKDTKTRACARRQPLWQWQFLFLFFFLLLCSSSPPLLNRQCMAPVCNNALQLCLQTNLVRIRHLVQEEMSKATANSQKSNQACALFPEPFCASSGFLVWRYESENKGSLIEGGGD